MRVTSKIAIKNFFKTGSEPTQENFWALIDSFWSKEERLGVSDIEDLENRLSEKLDSSAQQTIMNALQTQEQVWNQLVAANEAVYNDDSLTHAHDLLRLYDYKTGENVNYKKINSPDGIIADGVLYKFINNNLYKRQVSNFINLSWFQAEGDGITDDTAAVQSAIDIAVREKLNLIIPDADYVISNNIVANGSINIYSKGRFFLKNSSNKSMFIIENASSCVIDGLVLNGNRTNQGASNGALDLDENRHGIKLHRCKNLTVRNCTIHHCQGDGIGIEHDFVGQATTVNLNEDILVENNTIYSNGRNGVSVVHGRNIKILKNKIFDQKAYVSTLGSGVDVEPNPGLVETETYICENVMISDNLITENNEGIQIFKGKYNNSNVIRSSIKNVKISKNSFKNNVFTDILILAILGDKEIIVDGNTIENSANFSTPSHAYKSSIRVSYSDANVIISNNIVSAETPIEIVSSKNVGVFQNSFNFTKYAVHMRTDMWDEDHRNVELNQIKNNEFTINKPKTSDEAVFYKMIAETQNSAIKNNIISNNVFIDSNATTELNAVGYVFANGSGWNNINGNIIKDNYVKKTGAANTVYINTPTNNDVNIALS